MRYKALLFFFFAVLSGTTVAKWEKINDVDYTWGPFKIYNISLFTETGEYHANTRPLMLTLKYSKPVDGRDFAISVAKSWENLGIKLPAQDEVIDRLRKTLPDLKPGDTLNYIALEDRGYFVLNDQVIAQEFNADFNNAVLATWLDPKVDFSAKLTAQKADDTEQEVYNSTEYPQVLDEVSVKSKKIAAPGYIEFKDEPAQTEQAVDFDQLSAKPEVDKSLKKTEEPQKEAPKAVASDKPSQLAEEVNQSEADKTPPQSAEPEKTAPEATEPPAPAEPPAKPAEPAPKVDPENPEKEILPEFDPIQPYRPPVL